MTERSAVADLELWRDPARPATERVGALLAQLTLEEKIAQLYSVWIGATTTDGDMAPFQHDLVDDLDWSVLIRSGLGQLTRPFGTAPIEPQRGAVTLARMQTEIVAANRFGIPAIAHEECLTGFLAWRATIYPTPLAWGASFHPELVERMAAAIGTSMREVGIHQGLAPVLDVTRDLRWGRTEETIGEDPYLVATIGTAYVRGLQSAGIVATLKHFAGYSGSRAGRNFAPVAAGPRELADVFLLPFEMAIRDGGAGSVMSSYAEIDGIPTAADVELLTTLLRHEWGFTGTVVADYFGISFLETLHQVAGTPTEAAGLALAAGVDVELPAVRCYGPALADAVRAGEVPESLIDRAATRVLQQKCELGLLDAAWTPTPPALANSADGQDITFDTTEDRALARQLAEESVVLVRNDGSLPLARDARVAVVGPMADNEIGMLGCYTFPSHVGSQHPGLPPGVEIPDLLTSLSKELPDADVTYAAGCGVDSPDPAGIAAAVRAASEADVCVAVLGDRAGLFGQGTSGEGCDVADLQLPGIQAQLLEALLGTGRPVVLVMLAGRPYALGAFADRLAAIVQAFFPGEEGGPAVAGVLSGRVCPAGRLPVGIPRTPGGQPATYLATVLGRRTEVSAVDPTPLYGFGHGLSYTGFAWSDPELASESGTCAPGADGVPEYGTEATFSLTLTVRNIGHRTGTDVVQLYLHDPVAQVTRPVQRLIGYARVPLEPGQARKIVFNIPTDVACFTGRSGQRVVEAGDLQLWLGASSSDIRHTVPVRLVGTERIVDHWRALTTEVSFIAAD